MWYWMCFVFEHVSGTSGLDGGARRRLVHSERCSQCGRVLTQRTRVAAHVVAYPCANCCAGFMTLRSTCRSCNSKHRADRTARPLRERVFVRCERCCGELPFLGCVCSCWPLRAPCVPRRASPPFALPPARRRMV